MPKKKTEKEPRIFTAGQIREAVNSMDIVFFEEMKHAIQMGLIRPGPDQQIALVEEVKALLEEIHQ